MVVVIIIMTIMFIVIGMVTFIIIVIATIIFGTGQPLVELKAASAIYGVDSEEMTSTTGLAPLVACAKIVLARKVACLLNDAVPGT